MLMVVVPSEDAHQSEYVCDADKRRAFLSGIAILGNSSLRIHGICWDCCHYSG